MTQALNLLFRASLSCLPWIAVNASAEPDTVPTIPLERELPAVPETAPEALTTIVVTGEKLNRSAQDTASSVVVFADEELRQSTAASMKDVVTQAGNVVAASGDREISIRGVPQSGIGGEGETISVYLDGVALPARAANFAGPLTAWDLERVEVLRGSQSTNQGRNSLAGSVILASRQPTEDWDLRTRVAAMHRDGHEYAIAGGGPLTRGLRFRLSAQDRYERGDITNLTRAENDAGRQITRNWRGQFIFEPSFLPRYQLHYGYAGAENEFGDPLHDASNGERTQTSNVRGNEDVESGLHSLRQSYLFGDRWTVESISGWTDIQNLYIIDFDRSAADGGYSDNSLDENIFSQELRVRFAGERFRAVFGGYLSRADRDTETLGHDVAAAGGAALLNGFVRSSGNTDTDALFAEADWDVLPFLRLTLGARYNLERTQRSDESDLDITLTAPIPNLPGGIPVGVPLPDATSDLLAVAFPDFVPPDYQAADKTRFEDVLPKAGLTYLINDNASVSLTYQEGYRSGGVSVSFLGGGISPFEPEFTRSVELAARWQFPAQGLQLASNIFYTRWRDQQVLIGETSGFETTTENAGRSHYYGAETELRWWMNDVFELFSSLGYLHSEFDEFVNDGENYAGNEFPYAPEVTANLGLTMREWNRLSAQIWANYVGEVFGDPDNDPRSRSGARTLLHARVAYALPLGFTVSVQGRNLTDKSNEQGKLVAGDRIATRYGEPFSLALVLEWALQS